MRLKGNEFLNWDQKAVTLLGMSGVGKTRLACLLRNHNWFHYSGDYRIGTRYLDEPILDNIKQQAMQVPFLRDLLRSDSIHINNNITVDNLKPVSSFLGKVGNPELGGTALKDFKQRQQMHHEAEIRAMQDVPEFIVKARSIYGYDHFVNDAGGSLCELDDDDVLETLSDHTLILYIRASEHDEQALIQRAESDPKPMYYREAFLEEQLAEYLRLKKLKYVAQVDPDDFVRWVFPKLFYARIPRYEQIARDYGYIISSESIASISREQDFIRLISETLDNG
ncbi:MAG: ATPase [Thiotrichales bacterium]|nr:ATPase [Thiotrichales bacterium]